MEAGEGSGGGGFDRVLAGAAGEAGFEGDPSGGFDVETAFDQESEGALARRKGFGQQDADFRIAIFRHSGVVLPGHSSTKIVKKTAGELTGWIHDEAASRVAQIGGAARVIACTTP